MEPTELLRQFVGAHIIKDTAWEFCLLYDGDIGRLGGCVDGAVAEDWYNGHSKHIEYKTFNFKFLGDMVKVHIPVFTFKESDKKEYVSLTWLYKKALNNYMKQGVFGDKRGTIITRLLDNFELATVDWLVCFYEKRPMHEADIEFRAVDQKFEIDNASFAYDVMKQGDISRYENVLLLLKEVKEWYYDVRTHSIADKQWGQLVQQDYKMGKDVTILLNKKNEVISVDQVETEYGSLKERGGWYITTPKFRELENELNILVKRIQEEEGKESSDEAAIEGWKAIGKKIMEKQKDEKIPAADFVAHSSKKTKDGLEIKLIGAYTHVLRDILEFVPLSWQYNFLLSQRRLSFVAGSRRIGKTLLSSYLILRELWRMPNSIKHSQRTVKSMYIAPSEDKFKEVVDYIKTASESIRLLKVIDFNKSESRLYLYDEKVVRKQKTVTAVSSCDFTSGKGYEPGRGKASDFIVIDEAAFISEDVWLNILPILGNERARFYAISTIQWESMRNWFYEQLVDAEMDYDEEMFGMRVTIDDIEEVLIKEEDKRRMKKSLKHNQQRYYAELYATFPNAHNVFDSEGFFNVTKEIHPDEKLEAVIIGYDPAKRADTGAVIVSEVRHNKTWVYIELVEEYGMRDEYTNQKEFVAALKQSYIYKHIPVYLIMDVTGVGEAVSEIFGNIVDYKVLYTAKGARPTVDAWGAWKVPKSTLVHGTQILMEKNAMKGYAWLTHLMEEMKYFQSITTSSGNVKYEATSGHDDYVNAMMLVAFRYNYVEGHIYNMSTGKEVHLDWVNPWTGLFEPFSKREWSRSKLKGDSYGFGF